MALLRLDKVISSCGIASRREIKNMLRMGRVSVDGRTELSPEEKFDPLIVHITVDGEDICFKTRHILMMNKPGGVITATEDRNDRTVTDLLSVEYKKIGLFPVGRLDKDTEGFLLMTDDGDFCHNVISPAKEVGKIYYAEVAGKLSDKDVSAFRDGVILRDGLKCMPADLKIKESGEKSNCYILVFEGKYHQVKRMLASLGKPVTYLKRMAIGGVLLDGTLGEGKYRELTEEETADIFSLGKMKAIFQSL